MSMKDYSIPIFDSLVHPSITGNWIMPGYSQRNRIDDLLIEMETNNICNAFAVGMNTIGGYNENNYSEFILSKTDKLLPVAFFNVNEEKDASSVIEKIKYLKSKNYRGIKLHPRIGNFNLQNPLLPAIIKEANDQQLVVLLCTYFYENSENGIYNNLGNLLKLLIQIPNEKIILMHSGAVRLLEIMELARSFKRILLDLSFTMCKYEGSSIDIDIQYLFNSFDQRICIGSDFPEFSIEQMRLRFNSFARNISEDKAKNIACNNLLQFIKF